LFIVVWGCVLFSLQREEESAQTFEEEVFVPYPEEEIAVQSQQELAVQPTEEKVAVVSIRDGARFKNKLMGVMVYF
jgi:hypothetical protein